MLKTLLQFLINQSSKISVAWTILVWATIFSPHSFAQSKSATGIYDSYVSLLEISKENFEKNFNKLRASPSNLLDLKDLESIDLDPSFINHIMTYSPARYTYLGLKDDCSFYDLLLAGVLKDHNGPVDYVIVRYITKKNEKKRAYATLDAFISGVAIQKCPKIKTFQTYFTKDNFPKTVQAINLVPPTNVDDCKKVHKAFIEDHKTPYLCAINDLINEIPQLNNQLANTSQNNPRAYSSIQNKLKEANHFKDNINQKAQAYLENLCLNIEDEKTFCNNFFNKSFWSRVIDGEKPLTYMTSICQELLDRKDLNLNNYKACARQLNKDPGLCRWNGNHYPALMPKPSCNEIEMALNHSHLISDYQDCPGQVGNMAMINMARILRHFRPEEKKDFSFCSQTTASTFLNFNQEAAEAATWDLKLCYDDKLNEVEVCLPALTGNIEGNPFSISLVFTQIMSKTRGTDPGLECKLVAETIYNPNLLEYKNGCFITFNPEECSAVRCKHKFIYNEKEVTHVTEKQNIHIDYFPNDYKNEKFSQHSLMKEYLRIRESKLINITILKSFFKNHPKGIVHAMGCLENIYPEVRNGHFFNQCTPVPFIVDGFIEKGGYYSLVIRTALDDLHAPRIVAWKNIFTAVKSYQGYHPMKYWSLYGLYLSK